MLEARFLRATGILCTARPALNAAHRGRARAPVARPNRKIARSVHESSRDIARALANTDAYRKSRKDRKKVEMLFAHLKRILKLDRLRLRGRSGAQDEFLLVATAQNLRRMAKWLVPRAPNLKFAPA